MNLLATKEVEIDTYKIEYQIESYKLHTHTHTHIHTKALKWDELKEGGLNFFSRERNLCDIYK